MAEFAQIEPNQHDIPFSGDGVSDNALGLTNPDSVLTGTGRGTQNLGSPNIKTDSANQRIVVNDNTTNRVSFGRIGTGVNDWGLKVSKPTFNVDVATSDQLVFNSAQNVFKIIQKGALNFSSVTVTGSVGNYSSSNVTVGSVAHGLSFKPAVVAFLEFSNGVKASMPYVSNESFSTSTVAWTSYNAVVTSTNFLVNLRALAYGLSINTLAGTVTYYLLQESVD